MCLVYLRHIKCLNIMVLRAGAKMIENLFSIITIIAVLIVFGLYFVIKKEEKKDWLYGIYFGTVLLLGTVLYSIGLAYDTSLDTSFSKLFIVMNAFTHAFKSFGGSFAGDKVVALAKANVLYEVAIVMHFSASSILTALVLIKIFGKKIVNKIKVLVNSYSDKYIVLGMSDEAKAFLKNLDKNQRKKTTIILLPKDKDKINELMFSGFAVVMVKEIADGWKYKKDVGNVVKGEQELFEALEKAGLKRNKKITNIISMFENDNDNLIVGKIVTDYIKETICPVKDKSGKMLELSEDQKSVLSKTLISAHIMYKTLDIVEHFPGLEYALGRVKFFNPNVIWANKFMFENPLTSLIPKEWVDTKRARLFNAADGREYKNLKIGNFFIGYSESTRQLLKSNIVSGQMIGIDYNALVFSEKANQKENRLRSLAPGLFTSQEEGPSGNEEAMYYPDTSEKINIDFIEADMFSADFYKKVMEKIEGEGKESGFDYVTIIIELNSDKESIDVALELRHHLYVRNLLKTNCEKYDRVKIFVKAYSNSVFTSADMLNEHKDISCEISVFGDIAAIMNEEYIINEGIDKLAQSIANQYERSETNPITTWDSYTEFKRESNRYVAMALRTKLNLLGFDLVKGDKKTSAVTKDLYNKTYGMEHVEKLRKGLKKEVFVDFVEKEGDVILDSARNNLARLEHQRWNAFHLANGWTKLPKAKVEGKKRQDEKAKQHACITSFEGLIELREKQAKLLVKASSLDKQITEEEALMEADTIRYDYDIMDNLMEKHIDNSSYYVEPLN